MPSSLVHALFATQEPKGFTSASKHPSWVVAMDEELDALSSNDTWVLVPHPSCTNIVESKWVLRVKYLADDTVDHLKACLVAKSYSQLPSLDFHDTFSPVVKASTVRLVISPAMSYQWPLHQLDVKNAFLSGLLTKIVYMEQPPGYADP